jgi:hypothetical protein
MTMARIAHYFYIAIAALPLAAGWLLGFSYRIILVARQAFIEGFRTGSQI